MTKTQMCACKFCMGQSLGASDPAEDLSLQCVSQGMSDKDLTLMAQCHGQKTTGRSFDFWKHTNDSPFENNSQTQEDEQIDTIRTNTSYML